MFMWLEHTFDPNTSFLSCSLGKLTAALTVADDKREMKAHSDSQHYFCFALKMCQAISARNIGHGHMLGERVSSEAFAASFKSTFTCPTSTLQQRQPASIIRAKKWGMNLQKYTLTLIYKSIVYLSRMLPHISSWKKTWVWIYGSKGNTTLVILYGSDIGK